MSEGWWPKPPDNFKHRAVFYEIVEMAMEAVAQRMAADHRGFLTVIDGIDIDKYNRRWLGLERKEG